MRCCQIDVVDHPDGLPLTLPLKVTHTHTCTRDESSMSVSDLSQGK